MNILIYNNLIKQNSKIIINGEEISIPNMKDNEYLCISGICQPCINKNRYCKAICDIINNEECLTAQDHKDLIRIFKKLSKKYER